MQAHIINILRRCSKMENPIISDITNFIFVEDNPQKTDIIFLPGGSFPYNDRIPQKSIEHHRIIL